MKIFAILAVVLVLSVTLSACGMIPVDNLSDLEGMVADVWNAANSQIAAAGQEDNSSETSSAAGSDRISRETAIKIALEHAGFRQADVRELDAELDRERGVYEWEVEFEKGGYEYSYDIDAATGKILWSKKELED